MRTAGSCVVSKSVQPKPHGRAGAPCFLIGPGCIKRFDEFRGNLTISIPLRRSDFCIDLPTAFLKIMEWWPFSDQGCVCMCVREREGEGGLASCLCYMRAVLVNGHSDVICTNQQEAVITSSPCRIFQTSIGISSKKKPLILLI